MSNNQSIKLHFSCTFEILVAKSIEKEAFFRRDEADLHDRGITTARIDALAALRTTFIAIPTNHTEQQAATIAFNTRDAKNLELRVAVNEVLGIAANTFGKSSPQYKGFNIKGLTHFTPDELYIYSLNVVDKGNANLVAMEAKGLTPAMLTLITTLRDELIILIAAPPILVSDSVQITSTRKIAANLLFDELRNMCQTAIVYYKDRNKLKMADYYIYDITATEIVRKGLVDAGKKKNPKTLGIVEATIFKLKIETGVSLVFYFSMVKGTPPPVGATTILMNPNVFTILTAGDLGFDDAAGIIHLNIYNPNSDITPFFIKMI